MSDYATTYIFYIQATALDGTEFYQKAFIITINDCNYDQISVNQVLPDSSDAHYKSYKLVNNYPVLFINQPAIYSFKADIKQRLINIYNVSCPLIQFKISKVLINKQEVPSSQMKPYFQLSSQGVFQIMGTINQNLSNCQIFIEAFNTKIWSGDIFHQMIDLNLFESKGSLQYQKIDLKKNQYDSTFQTLNITIDLSKQKQGNLSYNISAESTITSKISLIQNQSQPFLSLKDVKSNQIILVIDVNKIKATGQYESAISIIDSKLSQQNIKIFIEVKNSNNLGMQAKIKSIDQYGLVTIKFSEVITLNKSIPWLNYTNQKSFNASWINYTNTDIYIYPALIRSQFDSFQQSSLELSWQTVKVQNDFVQIQLNFSKPYEISPLMVQDQLKINFIGSQYLLISEQHSISLDQKYWNLSSPIKKQMAQSQQLKNIFSLFSRFQSAVIIVIIIGALMYLLQFVSISHMILMIRSLQIILHLSLLQVPLPANVISYINIQIQLFQFDFLSIFNVKVNFLMPYIVFNDQIVPDIQQQSQDIGYDNRNAFQAYQTLTIVLYIYFMRIFFSLSMAIYQQFYPDCQKNKWFRKIFQMVKKGLFFNFLIQLSLEAYFEFFIGGILNFRSPQKNTNGEVLGILLASFCLSNILVNIPLLSLYILTKTFEQLNKKKFKEIFGEMYENTKYDSKLCLAYTSIFIMRRFLFLSFSLFFKGNEKGGFQLVLILSMNLAMIIYLVVSKSQKNMKLNYQEWFNEFFVQICTIQMTVFTDFVQDKEAQYIQGWYMIAYISFMLLCNFMLVFKQIFEKLYQLATKNFNLYIQPQQQKTIDCLRYLWVNRNNVSLIRQKWSERNSPSFKWNDENNKVFGVDYYQETDNDRNFIEFHRKITLENIVKEQQNNIEYPLIKNSVAILQKQSLFMKISKIDELRQSQGDNLQNKSLNEIIEIRLKEQKQERKRKSKQYYKRDQSENLIIKEAKFLKNIQQESANLHKLKSLEIEECKQEDLCEKEFLKLIEKFQFVFSYLDESKRLEQKKELEQYHMFQTDSVQEIKQKQTKLEIFVIDHLQNQKCTIDYLMIHYRNFEAQLDAFVKKRIELLDS